MPRVIRTSRARRPAAGRGPSRLLTGVGHQAGLVLAPGSRGGRSARARIPGLVRRRRRGGRAAAVAVMSTTNVASPRAAASRRTARSHPALLASISGGAATTALGRTLSRVFFG